MDPEQIVGLLPGTKRKLLPLAGNFKYVQASLQLEHLRLVIVRRPPCASEGYLEQGHTGIALSMADSHGLKLDGVELDQPAIVTHGMTTPHFPPWNRTSMPTGSHRSRTRICNSIAVTNDRVRLAACCFVTSILTAVGLWSLVGWPETRTKGCGVLRRTNSRFEV